MFKKIKMSMFPEWFKWILYIILIVTCVYWICLAIYKLLEIIRVILQTITKKEHYWFMVIIIIGVGITAVLLGQYCFGLNPLGRFAEWVEEMIREVRQIIANKIAS